MSEVVIGGDVRVESEQLHDFEADGLNGRWVFFGWT